MGIASTRGEIDLAVAALGPDAYGSMLKIVQPFTVTGTPSQVTGVTITLTNSVGTSTPVTVSF